MYRRKRRDSYDSGEYVGQKFVCRGDGERHRSFGGPFDSDANVIKAEDNKTKIGKLIFRLGDKKDDFVDECKTLISSLDMDLINRGYFIQFIVECCSEIPWKTCIYSSFLRKLNIHDSKFCGDILNKSIECLSKYYNENEFERFEILFRCIADLVSVGVIGADTWLKFVSELICDVDSEPNKVECGFLVSAILSAFLFNHRSLTLDSGNLLSSLLQTVENLVVSEGETQYRYLFPISFQPKGRLLQLLETVKYCLEHDIGSIFAITRPKIEKETPVMCQHSLGRLSISATSKQLFALSRLSTFDMEIFVYRDDGENVSEAWKHPHNLFMIEDLMRKCLFVMEFNHAECMNFIKNMVFKNQDVLHHVVRVIFQEITVVGTPRHKMAYYVSIMIECVKHCDYEKTTSTLKRFVDAFIDRIEEFCYRQICNMSDFFSLYLNNTLYNWEWSSLVETISSTGGSDKISPNLRLFLRCLVKMSLDLSYYEYIESKYPKELLAFLENVTDSEPFPYEDHRIYEIIKSNTRAVHNDVINQIVTFPGDDGDVQRIFVFCMLHYGKKSFSHTSNIIRKYKQVITEFFDTEQKKIMFLKLMKEFYQTDFKFLHFSASYLISERILSPEDVLEWIFCGEYSISADSSFWILPILENITVRIKTAIIPDKDDKFLSSMSRHILMHLKSCAVSTYLDPFFSFLRDLMLAWPLLYENAVKTEIRDSERPEFSEMKSLFGLHAH